ncbi:MAG: phosphatase PAP2 family protein [Oceanospirillales bacterium]|nr:phosphatase PAP2 family protein [Oceanospirillales bacterium]
MNVKVQAAELPFPATAYGAGWLRLLQPLGVAILLQSLISGWQLDLAWSSWLYAEEGRSWILRDSWFFSEVVHKGGRELSIGLLILVCMAFAVSWKVPALSRYRRVLLYLILGPATASALVAGAKHITGVDCPWSLDIFGGDQPYVPLVQNLLRGGGDGVCFPAGHASAGYAWLALYFAAVAVAPRWRYVALAAALGAGLLFGVSQQLRGAHFLSHDLWSLVLCWYTVMLLARWMLAKSDKR